MTARPVLLSARDGVAVAVIDNPPVNALGHAVRAGLWAVLDAVAADPALSGLVMRAEGRTWPAGADIREFGAPPRSPVLAELCDRIEGFAKPVVVILHGTVLGGGLELALAARARLARAGASFGLPEVSLGLCPGAGGTRRLPALVGAKAALGLMLTGLPVAAGAAEAMGLIDGTVGEDAEAVAAELVRTLGAEGPAAPRPPRDTPEVWMGAVNEARAGLGETRLAAPLPAPARIIDCVEAALLLPAQAAARFERAAFADLMATPESRALRHAFFAERRAGRSGLPADAAARAPGRVAVLGRGPGMAALAGALAGAGLEVTLVTPGPVSDARAEIGAAGAAMAASGRVGPGGWAEVAARIAVTDAPAAVSGAGATLAPDAESAVPGALTAGPAPVLICDAAEAQSFRDALPDIATRSFAFLPVPSPSQGRLVELVAPAGADPAALGVALALSRRMGRTAVVTHAVGALAGGALAGGSAGAALTAALWAAADRAVEDGASPYQVDRALAGWGFARGPFALRDGLGLDRAPLPPRGSVCEALWLALMEEGRIGVVTGTGFYVHPGEGRGGAEDAGLGPRLEAARVRTGSVPRAVGDDEIVMTTLAALAATGARLVQSGAVARPSDVDVLAMGGLGFPRWRGGPMQATDEGGVLSMRNLLRDLARDGEGGEGGEGGDVWTPAPLWDELIRNGQRFADLNG